MNNLDLSQIHLRYALQSGKPVNIRAFADCRYSKRPTDLYCPECDGGVRVVLQKDRDNKDRKIRDHFRHLPDSTCALRDGGESVHHLNAKIYLAEQLSKYRHATLSYRCQQCTYEYAYLRINDYDEVVPEMKVGKRKPDISCLHAKQPIGAAEIFHKHAVDAEKQYDLNQMGLVWFEIPAMNVNPRYFRFLESRDVISIDAQGAGITYPEPPKMCDACAEEIRRQEFRRHQDQLKAQEERLKREHELQLQREQEEARREELRLAQERRLEALARQRRQEYEEWQREREERWRQEAEQRAEEEAEREKAERIAKEEAARLEAERIAFYKKGGAAYLTPEGELRCRDYFNQPMGLTLAALNAPLKTWRLYRAHGPHLLTPKHAEVCKGQIERTEIVAYCDECGYFTEVF